MAVLEAFPALHAGLLMFVKYLLLPLIALVLFLAFLSRSPKTKRKKPSLDDE
ncbi:MAG: hypothetical protein GW911_25305 [Armatimonadetes bacterium]|nr:hypothetical protein [Armatimonadota bacterium]NCO95174.1 hypothetical protein [Armatimonadota bacterium]NCP30888.1 hypothetical protein [Armatimonadota bacterium]NCQ28300.1 hypothetical protein [Armatimonadota bacterium]NDK15361.1 hypothetical protein [Armatimonadota bacterium]